jgi:hypothetical protein
MRIHYILFVVTLLFLTACQQSEGLAPAEPIQKAASEPGPAVPEQPPEQPSRFDIYATVRLTADLSHLSEQQKQMIPLLIEASETSSCGIGIQCRWPKLFVS